MKNRRVFTIIFVAVCAIYTGPAAVFASQKAVEIPVEVKSVANVRHIGKTRLKVFGFSIYDAQLWAAADFSVGDYANTSFALEIDYLRNFDNDAVAQRSIKEMRNIGSMKPEQESLWLAEMSRLFPDIKKGDRLVGIHQPGVGAVFAMNGKTIGEIRDPEFARLFFGIWLSPKTSQPQMRRELLGAKP